jgi:hypothetical protein
MSKKPDTAAALAGILQAKRSEAGPSPTPSPALPPVPPPAETPKAVITVVPKGRGGKSSDPNYSQYSIYLRKAVRKKVGRALDDDDTGQDFSELVEELLEKWLASRS